MSVLKITAGVRNTPHVITHLVVMTVSVIPDTKLRALYVTVSCWFLVSPYCCKILAMHISSRFFVAEFFVYAMQSGRPTGLLFNILARTCINVRALIVLMSLAVVMTPTGGYRTRHSS